jgi:hypothetical protein
LSLLHIPNHFENRDQNESFFVSFCGSAEDISSLVALLESLVMPFYYPGNDSLEFPFYIPCYGFVVIGTGLGSIRKSENLGWISSSLKSISMSSNCVGFSRFSPGGGRTSVLIPFANL